MDADPKPDERARAVEAAVRAALQSAASAPRVWERLRQSVSEAGGCRALGAPAAGASPGLRRWTARHWAALLTGAAAVALAVFFYQLEPRGPRTVSPYPVPLVSGDFELLEQTEVGRGAVVLAWRQGATVNLGNYCRLEMDPQTEIVIGGAEREEEVFLRRGRLLCDVDRNVGTFAVRTEAATVSVAGTRFSVRVADVAESGQDSPRGGTPMFGKRVIVQVVSGLVLASGSWGICPVAAGEPVALPPAGAAPTDEYVVPVRHHLRSLVEQLLLTEAQEVEVDKIFKEADEALAKHTRDNFAKSEAAFKDSQALAAKARQDPAVQAAWAELEPFHKARDVKSDAYKAAQAKWNQAFAATKEGAQCRQTQKQENDLRREGADYRPILAKLKEVLTPAQMAKLEKMIEACRNSFTEAGQEAAQKRGNTYGPYGMLLTAIEDMDLSEEALAKARGLLEAANKSYNEEMKQHEEDLKALRQKASAVVQGLDKNAARAVYSQMFKDEQKVRDAALRMPETVAKAKELMPEARRAELDQRVALTQKAQQHIPGQFGGGPGAKPVPVKPAPQKPPAPPDAGF